MKMKATYHPFESIAPKESFARFAWNCIKVVSKCSVSTHTTDFILFGFSSQLTATDTHGSTINTDRDTITGWRCRSRWMYRTVIIGIQATFCIHQWILIIHLLIHYGQQCVTISATNAKQQLLAQLLQSCKMVTRFAVFLLRRKFYTIKEYHYQTVIQ